MLDQVGGQLTYPDAVRQYGKAQADAMFSQFASNPVDNLQRSSIEGMQYSDQGSIMPRERGIKDNIQEGAVSIMQQMGMSPQEAQQHAYKWSGADGSMGAADFAPGVGDAIGFEEAGQMLGQGGQSYDQGNYGDAALQYGGGGVMAALSAAGMLGAIKPVTGAARGAVKRGVTDLITRDSPLLQRVGDAPLVNKTKIEYGVGEEPIPEQMLTAEDLINRPYVSTMADTSRGGLETVDAIDGTEIGATMHGGRGYMRQDNGGMWASDEQVVKNMMTAAEYAKKLPNAERSPVFLPYQMGGQSTDFATMTADTMIPYARQNMSKGTKKALDERIRKGTGAKGAQFQGLPEWPGVDSPDAMSYIEKIGGWRKNVNQAMDEFRNDGGLSLSQARAAITDPTQLNPSVGNVLPIGEFDMGQSLRPSSHPTYNTVVPGGYMGTLADEFNVLDAKPIQRGTGEAFVPLMQSRGHKIGGDVMPSAVGAAMKAGLVGVMDQDVIDLMIKQGLIKP